MKSDTNVRKQNTDNQPNELHATIELFVGNFMNLLIAKEIQHGYIAFKKNQKLELYFNFLRSLHITECNKFADTVNKSLDPQSYAASFFKLTNKLFNSNDIEFLSEKERLYKDILSGRLCPDFKPRNDEEALERVHMVQDVMKQKYSTLLEIWETQYSIEQQYSPGLAGELGTNTDETVI